MNSVNKYIVNRLERELKEHKKSKLFFSRNDIELYEVIEEIILLIKEGVKQND